MEEGREFFRESLDKLRNKFKRVNNPFSLEDLAEKIKGEVDVNKKVEGTIFCEFGPEISGSLVKAVVNYHFLTDYVKDELFYDTKNEARKEAFEDGLKNFAYYMKPYPVTSLGNKIFVETPKRELSKESQLSLFD